MLNNEDRQAHLESVEAAVQKQDWVTVLALTKGWLACFPDDSLFLFHRGVALLSTDKSSDGRTLLALLAAKVVTSPSEQLRAVKSSLILGVTALASNDSETGKTYLERVLEVSNDSTDTDICSAAVQAGCYLGELYEKEHNKEEMQRVYSLAIEKAKFAKHQPVIDKAAYAALMLSFSIENNDVLKMQTLSHTLDLAMRSKTETAKEVALLASGAIIPLAFITHRHPAGKELESEL